MTKITAVVGSVTPPGRLNRAVAEACGRARDAGHEVDLVDLGAVTVGWADGRPLDAREDEAAAVVAKVAAADAVILASPVYRASMTGALKNLLDLVPCEALTGKPCGIVAMGATPHHYLGVDSHLRDVLAWFGALVAPTSVYLVSADFTDGAPSGNAAQALDDLVATVVRLASVAAAGPLGPAPLATARR